MGSEYIKFILHLSWTNYFEGVIVLNVTTLESEVKTQDKLSINFATERRLKVKQEIYKTLSMTWF